MQEDVVLFESINTADDVDHFFVFSLQLLTKVIQHVYEIG